MATPEADRAEQPDVTYVRERLAELPVGGLLRAWPRAATFMARSMGRSWRAGHQQYPEIPTRTATPAMMASVLADEVVLATLASARLVPPRHELERIEHEVAAAVALFRDRDWVDKPAAFHEAPGTPDHPKLVPEQYRRTRYEHLTFDSGYRPRPGMPGAARWLAQGPNQVAHAYVMRHTRGPRPWLVNIHGFSMGKPSDLPAFRALHAFRDLGFNVIQPVLPLHGPRRIGKRSGDGFATFDFLNNVHGTAQALSDIRSCIAWAREQGSTGIHVHGVSLGGYTAALLAGLEPGIDTVIAGIPTADMAWVMRHYVPNDERADVERHGLIGENADVVHSVVAPLALDCLVPKNRRFIYSGVGDRMATPMQAYVLWKHWDEPRICWYAGSHVGYVWSGEVRRFVEEIISGVRTTERGTT